MTFVVTFIALIIERFFDWSHLRHWQWYYNWQRWVMQRLVSMNSYVTLAATVLPLLLAVAFVGWLVDDWLYGFMAFLFQLFILICCLGPQNLWADTFACINALTQGDAQTAAGKLQASFGIIDTSYSQSLHRHLLNDVFIEANRRVFAVVFWYVFLGPVGAVLYRTVVLSAIHVSKQSTPSLLIAPARIVQAVLDWIPVRIFTFVFALGGNFVHVLSCWRKKVLQGLNSNEAMLIECGNAAIGFDEPTNLPEDGSAERQAISLLDRVFIIVLIVIFAMELVG